MKHLYYPKTYYIMLRVLSCNDNSSFCMVIYIYTYSTGLVILQGTVYLFYNETGEYYSGSLPDVLYLKLHLKKRRDKQIKSLENITACRQLFCEMHFKLF